MRHIAFLAFIVLAACGEPPVEWAPIVYQNPPIQPAEFPGPAQSVPPVDACPGSIRVARTGADEYAVWWESNQDSSVTLFTSRREGKTWGAPVAADTTDHGVRGCGRPAPAIAVDSATDYVHIAYFSEPKTGAGIFFAHSMDQARTFHSPVPIVFGRAPSRVSVASNGDRVVVGYEDPNAKQPLVGIALSKTMGHIFESRSTASSENGRARQPVVRVTSDSIRVWWSEYSPDPTVSATRSMYRAAHWK